MDQCSKLLTQVTDDDELKMWYEEIQKEGHPDANDVNGNCWIKLTDISSLVQILATMAWIGWVIHTLLRCIKSPVYKATPLCTL